MPYAKKQKRAKLAGEGVKGRLVYFAGRAMANIRQNFLISLLTVVTIAVSLLLISLFLLVFVNLESLADSWSEKVQVTGYFDHELSPPELAALTSKLRQLPGTDKVAYVSRSDALKRFKDRLKGQEALLEGVPADILPSSVDIRLKRDYRQTEEVEAYVARLKKATGITEVQYGEEWVKRFSTFMNFMRLVGAILGVFLTLAVVFIVSNTIKLTIYSRKEELEVMELVGGTPFFIKAPFLIEGVVQGMTGGVIALVILAASYWAFLNNAGNFLSFDTRSAGLVFLPPQYLAGILAGGIAVGFIGSLASLKRFVNPS